MTLFKSRISRIKGLSERRRLPRLGKIRLGIKRQSSKTGAEYPHETDYFVVPDEVAAVYGNTPTELDVMLPVNDIESVFPQAYKWYGQSIGLKCTGDGEVAYRVNDEGEMVQRTCPCELLEGGKCKQRGVLMVMLPKVSVGGIYQIGTSSYNSIVDINSGIDYVQALIGRFAMVPLKLRRVKTETHHDQKKQHHFTLQIVCDLTLDQLDMFRKDSERILTQPAYQLPAPEETNPELDPVDEVVDEDIVDEEDLPEQDEIVDAEPTVAEPKKEDPPAPAPPEAKPDHTWTTKQRNQLHALISDKTRNYKEQVAFKEFMLQQHYGANYVERGNAFTSEIAAACIKNIDEHWSAFKNGRPAKIDPPANQEGELFATPRDEAIAKIKKYSSTKIATALAYCKISEDNVDRLAFDEAQKLLAELESDIPF